MLPLEGACGREGHGGSPLHCPGRNRSALQRTRAAYPRSVERSDVSYVLFDLDDTLVDHRAAASAAFGHAIARWSPDGGRPRPRRVPGAVGGSSSRSSTTPTCVCECTHAEQRVRRLRPLPSRARGQEWGRCVSSPRSSSTISTPYVAAWSHFADVFVSSTSCEPPTSALPSSRTASPGQQRLKLDRTGLVDRFDLILTPTEGCASRSPTRGRSATHARCSGSIPTRTAYVGDNLEVDAVGASAAGLRGIWLDRSRERRDGAAREWTRITSLSALIAALR